MNRTKQLLKILSNTKEPQTAFMIALKLGISVRTVRTLIADIMNDPNNLIIITSGKNGYLLEKGDTGEAAKGNNVNDSLEFRVRYILQRLLSSDDYIKLEELADELFISSASINRNIRVVRQILDANELILVQKPSHGIKVEGLEKNKRICYIHTCIETDNNDITAIAEKCGLTVDDYFKIKYIIEKAIRDNTYNLTDEGTQNIVIHLLFSISRITNGNYIEKIPKEYESTKKVNKVAQDIINMIQEGFEICFPESEKNYVCIHLLGKSANVGKEEIVISSETERIIREVNDKIKKILGYDFTHDFELFSMLAVHIEPMLVRLRYRLKMSNPLIDDIKVKYTKAYECAVIAAEYLQERKNLKVPDTEIGYLAIHYNLALERLAQSQDDRKFLMVCGSGVSTAMMLKKKIEIEFETLSKNIVISDLISIATMDLSAYDYIISTVPIPYVVHQKVIYVENVLSNVHLKELGNQRQYDLVKYMEDDLIFLNQSFKTRDEVIKFLCRQFEIVNHLDKEFTASVQKRESLSSTEIGNLVAVPHTMGLYIPKTRIAVLTLAKSILWENKKVRIVILIAYASKDLKNIFDINERLMDLLMNTKTVNQISTVKTVNELKTVFL